MKNVLCLLFAFSIASLCSAETKPNVLIFLTDDQGWGDLSANGNTNLTTPNIDSLARNGATFENFYVCAVCAPTRAEFLTGRYHPRTGVSGVSTGQGRLNVGETTVADVFKSAGYATGAFGKWHNGTQSPYHPNDRGFDEYYGFTSGHWGHYFSPPLDHNGKKVRGNGYVVDDFTDHALDFIEANRDRPFLCYVPYNTPHSPMMIDDQFYKKFANVDPNMKHRDPKKEDVMMTRAALAMCENIDWNVGRILKKLDELKLRENTIVIYFSDNGPNSFRWNGGMKGKKGSVDEGGVRSPFFVRWPKRIRAGSSVPEVTAGIDLLPTLSAMAGIDLKTSKPIDGRDFSPLLFDGEAKWESRAVFSVWRKRVSVRTERFRLDDIGQLFDIANDRGQLNNVADRHPDEVRRLQKVSAEFRAEMTKHYAEFADRPFTVGYAKSTTLPARDGISHGSIKRSSKAPNNSFFENWTDEDDSITWDIEVDQAGKFEATVYYTCKKTDVGATIRLAAEGEFAEAKVAAAFDPQLYDKSKERVANSHYFVKDFKPLSLGTLNLAKGRSLLRLTAPKITGEEAIDVHSIELRRR
jgi:arylsulfatase A-like enzyme